MKKALFPGTFDPPTLGHLDVINRAASLFDHLYVAVGHNPSKKSSVFNLSERMDLLRKIVAKHSNIEIVSFDGLVVDFAKQLNVSFLIKALRNSSDFDCEILQANMNWQLEQIETLYMVASEQYRLISSSLVREIARFGRRLHSFLPAEIEDVVFQRLSGRNSNP